MTPNPQHTSDDFPVLDRALSAGPNTLLSPEDLATILECSRATLARWRMRRLGPVFVKFSRSKVAYRAQDVLDFIESRRIAA